MDEGAAPEGGLERRWRLLQGMTVNQAHTQATNPEIRAVRRPMPCKCGWE